MKRWLVPLVAAAAVLTLVGGLWWFSSARIGDGEPVGPGAAPPAVSDPGGGVKPFPGSPGSEPGSEPSGGAGGSDGSGDQPRMTNPKGVRIDGYDVPAPRQLRLHYTIGVPECYGTIDDPVVEETETSVTVTLTRVEPRSTGDVACIEIALLKKVTITLDRPLDGRLVRDGSFGGAVVRPAMGNDAAPR